MREKTVTAIRRADLHDVVPAGEVFEEPVSEEVRFLLDLQGRLGLGTEEWLDKVEEVAVELVGHAGEAAEQLVSDTLIEKLRQESRRMQRQHDKLQYLHEVRTMLDFLELRALRELDNILSPPYTGSTETE